MLNKNWKIFPCNEQLIKYLSKELDISYIVSHLLINRGIQNPSDALKFLNPRLSALGSPFDMKDMDQAVSLIIKKIKSNDKIFIYGDYDVDGITAIAVLYKLLSLYQKNVNFYIPHRVEEGYGLNSESLNQIKQQGGSLVITVDCGIQSIEEVAYAKSIGLDIIITDHHLPAEKLPSADAIINPRQNGCKYHFKDLAGVGVAFQLVRAIKQKLLNDATLSVHQDSANESMQDEEMLALTAIGAIADMVPLIGENRILVKYGLDALNKTTNPGLLSLIHASGLKDKKIDTSHVAFWLAPRLNATGRMKDANMALELLLTNDIAKSQQIATELNSINTQRQKLLETTMEHAVLLVEKHIDLKNEQIIVLAWQDWHPGIVGLVASRLVEKYSRPALVISLDKDSGKGSGRSIKNVDLFKTISECKHLLVKAGGHHQAVGFSIQKENIKTLRKEINAILKNTMSWEQMQIQINIDQILKPSEINLELAHEIEKLIPFGLENPRPVFALKKIHIRSNPKILKEKHLKFQVGEDNIVLDAIGFNQAEKINLLQQEAIDIAFNLDINTWQGQEILNLQIKELGNDKI